MDARHITFILLTKAICDYSFAENVINKVHQVTSVHSLFFFKNIDNV